MGKKEKMITKILISIFFYGFFLLIAGALMEWVDKKPPKHKTVKNLIKIYWSEVFLVLFLLLGASFFIKGVFIKLGI